MAKKNNNAWRVGSDGVCYQIPTHMALVPYKKNPSFELGLIFPFLGSIMLLCMILVIAMGIRF